MKSNWIRVDHTWPPRDKLLLLFVPWGTTNLRQVIGYYDQHVDCMRLENGIEILADVTHWQPLPEDPVDEVRDDRAAANNPGD
jgi:hypothetical protein